VADLVLSAAGEVIQGRGAATEELAARVAYAARLADLIGRAIRSGTPRALELRGKSTQTIIHWQADGNLSASLDLPVPSRR
jgi:predicted regulator of Ras-like GTPase activity (Roadblock/LC7/MglB family)